MLGATRAARACSICARPISPPSAATPALLDMFCGLNGATLTPRSAKARQRPATISDLPTLDPVPWTMTAGTRGIGFVDAPAREAAYGARAPNPVGRTGGPGRTRARQRSDDGYGPHHPLL